MKKHRGKDMGHRPATVVGPRADRHDAPGDGARIAWEALDGVTLLSCGRTRRGKPCMHLVIVVAKTPSESCARHLAKLGRRWSPKRTVEVKSKRAYGSNPDDARRLQAHAHAPSRVRRPR